MSTKKLTHEQFLNRCKFIHGEKFNYSAVEYKNMTTKITISCNACRHEWQVTPGNHIGPKQSGCPNCKRLRQFGRDTKSNAQVLQEVKKVHGDNLLYDKFLYKNCKSKVIVGCKIHGYFKKWPNDLKYGSGCSKCSGNYHKSHLDFINEVNTQNSYIKVVGSYVNAHTKLEFYCNKHNRSFFNKPNDILSGHIGCIDCSYEKSIQSKIKSGQIPDPLLKTEYEKYRIAVWRYSNRTYKKSTLGKRDKNNHLDHILSIVEGFKNNVSPEVMGSIYNLRIIPSNENRKKSFKSHITSGELIEAYLQNKD